MRLLTFLGILNWRMNWFFCVLLLKYVIFFTISTSVFGVYYIDISENLSSFFDSFLFAIFVKALSLDFSAF